MTLRRTLRVGALVALVVCPSGCHRCPRYASIEEEHAAAAQNPAPGDHECIERWAEHVCTWTAERHAARRRTARQVEESYDQRGALWEMLEVHCGCLAQSFGDCFLQLNGPERTGFVVYHVATGAPGCGASEQARRVLEPPWTPFRAGTSGVADPGQCGSVFRLRYQRADTDRTGAF